MLFLIGLVDENYLSFLCQNRCRKIRRTCLTQLESTGDVTFWNSFENFTSGRFPHWPCMLEPHEKTAKCIKRYQKASLTRHRHYESYHPKQTKWCEDQYSSLSLNIASFSKLDGLYRWANNVSHYFSIMLIKKLWRGH